MNWRADALALLPGLAGCAAEARHQLCRTAPSGVPVKVETAAIGEWLMRHVAACDHDLAEVIVPPALGDGAGITGAIELGRMALGGEG